MVKIPEVDPIAYLVRRRFPHLEPPSPMAQQFNRVRYVPPAASIRRAAKAYEAELKALSLQDLESRYIEAQEEEAAERKAAEEQRRSFNLPNAMADNEHWARMDTWTLEEAVALLLGRDPSRVSPRDLAHVVASSEFAATYAKLAQLARRSVEDRRISARMRPSDYLRWAESKRVAFPKALLEAVDRIARQDLPPDSGVPSPVGAIHTHDADAAREADAPLTGAAKSDGVNKRELSTRERNTCLKIIIGMAVAGYKYDPRVSRSRVPQEIVDDIALVGLSVDVDTVRKWLREAAELLDGPGSAV